MLLPSAFPCSAPATPGSRPAGPKLESSIPYQPLHPAQRAATSLLASCRALQAILGNATGPAPPQSSTRPAPSQRQQSLPPPTALRNEWPPTPPAEKPTKRLGAAHPAPPRGLNKRRRSDFEEDQEMPDTSEEKENFERIYLTPKRHRKTPVLMPLGLSAEDFDALEDPSVDQDEQISLPPPGPQAGDSNDDESWTLDEFGNWSAADDKLLVETVLEKLKLSKREWNDCARRLGKDKDTLGRRWKMLVVEGNVGLRRGGRLRRTDLDIDSW